MSDDFDELLADRPDTVHVDGVGDVPVVYAPAEPAPPPVFPNDRLRVADGIVWQEVDDELVVYRPVDPAAHVLNPTAALLWQCMDGEGTVGETFADLAGAFGVPLDVVENDFVPVIADWKRDGLVAPVGETPAPSVAAGATAQPWRFLADPPND